MPTCIVCLNTLKDPAALPCGHVFCYDCIIRLIRSITPYSTNHFCPTCKQPYTISNVDPKLVPHHLRPYMTPSVRKLCLEYTIPMPSTLSTPQTDYERLLAENASLKTCCAVWRKRAAVHAAATLGLVGLARLARDYALRLKKDKEDMEAQYNELTKKMEDKTNTPDTPPDSPPSCPPSPRNADLRSSSSSSIHLPHFCELNLEPLEADIPPSIARVSSLEPLRSEISPGISRLSLSDYSEPSDHHALSPSLYRIPSPALSEESYCSECSDCTHSQRKRTRDEFEEGEDPEARREESEPPIKRSYSSSPTLLAPAPLSPERAIANYLEGSLAV